jgi:Na+/H+ antiporter NhaA
MNAERIDKILRPFQKFIHEESSSGIVLLVCTVIALILSNSPLSDIYHDIWSLEFSIGFAGYEVVANYPIRATPCFPWQLLWEACFFLH